MFICRSWTFLMKWQWVYSFVKSVVTYIQYIWKLKHCGGIFVFIFTKHLVKRSEIRQDFPLVFFSSRKIKTKRKKRSSDTTSKVKVVMDCNVFSWHILERMDFEVWKMVFGKPQHTVESCMVRSLRWGWSMQSFRISKQSQKNGSN